MQDDRVPYATKTGIKIGSRYEPPMRADYSHEERFAQNLLLGTTGHSYKDKFKFVAYCLCVVGIVFLLSALGVK